MIKILGISGSLRRASFNTALLRAAVELMPADSELTVKTLHGIPLYDGDVEDNEGIPLTVSGLRDAIMECDGLILCTPEYNHSIPGVFKNAIDWLSRTETEERPVFMGRPVALMGASPGAFGTVLSQEAWLPVLRTLETRPYLGDRMLVSRSSTLFDPAGALTDEGARKRLTEYLRGFAAFVKSQKR